MTARKRAQDFDERILEIFDGYVHGRISKREFIAWRGQPTRRDRFRRFSSSTKTVV